MRDSARGMGHLQSARARTGIGIGIDWRMAVALAQVCRHQFIMRSDERLSWLLRSWMDFEGPESTRGMIENADVETSLELVVNHDSVTCQCPGRT